MIRSTSKTRAWMVSVALTALVPNAQAVVDCTGTVTNLSLRLDTVGTVTLSLSGGPSWVYLCDVDGAGRNGVSPTVCRTMYASLMAAYQTGKPVLIRFYDHAACAAIPSWADAGALGWTRVAW